MPIVTVVTGEGGSGGALAIGMGNRVLMLEHAVYSVISPEGCAAILWGDAAKAPEAAELMRITAPDLLRLGVIDAIVPEPPGGAHRDWEATAAGLREALRTRSRRSAPSSRRRARRPSATRSSAGSARSRKRPRARLAAISGARPPRSPRR